MNLSSSTSLRRRSSSYIAQTAMLLLLIIYCSCCRTLSLVDAKTPLSSVISSARRSALLKPSLIHQNNNNIIIIDCHQATSDSDDVSRSGITSSPRLAHIPSFLQKRRNRVTSYSSSSANNNIDFEWSISTGQLVTSIRGGDTTSDSSSDDDDEYDSSDELSDDEYDSEEYEETTDSDEYDSESEEDDEEEDAVTTSLKSTSLKSSIKSKSSKNNDEKQPIVYDDLLTPPAMQQVFISVGVMLLSNKIDITDSKPVRIARIAFVTYIITVQVFLAYVYLRAKSINDRTSITISNPLASLVQQQQGGGGGGSTNFMVKALTDQILSTSTTILEYDLQQAKKMNGGLLFPMIMLYFLHFKMKQVQPLLMQTATGVMNLVYSPLFQVYVLGRNLERPFKPPVNPMMDALQQKQQLEEEGQEEGEGNGDDEGDADDSGEGQDVEDEDGESEEDADDEEDEMSDEDEYESDDE